MSEALRRFDPDGEMPVPESARLNLLDAAVKRGWGGNVPLSVRLDAARAADDIVMAWVEAPMEEPLHPDLVAARREDAKRIADFKAWAAS